MTKVLVFDMDGTLADFYGVAGWLDYLENSDATPYIVAEPLYDMAEFNALLLDFKAAGWKIVITSWLAKNSSRVYDKKVRAAKREWLAKYNVPVDEIHLVRYGATKADSTRNLGGFQILVDDNAQVRAGWRLGGTVDATQDIMTQLREILAAA